MRHSPYIALGYRLRSIPEVITLGVKSNFIDYSAHEKNLIDKAEVILYPSLNYAQFFSTIGRKIFPSVETYLYADEKIKQTSLFNILNLPHPKTRFYYRPQTDIITNDFAFPFVGKIPRASSRGRGVFLINNKEELSEYLCHTKIAYIQEYLPHDRDLRVILINYHLILAYWRRRSPDDFRTNLFQGGTIDFQDIPMEAVDLAQNYARQCRFNDVGLDLIKSKGKWYLIEANMQYGRKGLRMKGMILKEIIRQKLLEGTLLEGDTKF